MPFWEQLNTICTKKACKPNTVAKAIGLSSATATKWKNGAVPNGEALTRIADYLDCSVDYLLGRPARDNNLAIQTSPKDFTLSERGMIKKYRALDEHGKDMVDTVLDKEYERSAAVTDPNAAEEEPVLEYIRHYFVPAAAGYASPVEGEDYELIAKDESVPAAADFCIDIQGDSMEPYIKDGQRVYVQRDASLTDFDVGIFLVDGNVYCKQYCIDHVGNLYLLSANPKREDANKTVLATSGSTVVCFGKVILKKKLPEPYYP